MGAPKGSKNALGNKGGGGKGKPKTPEHRFKIGAGVTIYDEKMPEKALEYLEGCVDTNHSVSLPSKEGLALYLGVDLSTVYNWRDKYPEFAKVFTLITLVQAERLINKGLSGDYEKVMVRLLLSKHGYKEQYGLSGEGEGEPIKLDVGITELISKVYGNKRSGKPGGEGV